MPGEHVDAIIKSTIANLEKQGAVGKVVFEDVESSSLTPSEKQEVYRAVVKDAVAKEMATTTNPGTLLRGNSSQTQFMTSYMNKYAAPYFKAVYDTALTQAVQVKLPDSIQGKPIPMAGKGIEGATPEDMAKLNQTTVDLARSLVEASDSQLSKLPPEVREFMKAALEPCGDNNQAICNTSANLLLLRGVSPYVTTKANEMRLDTDPEVNSIGSLMINSNVVLQTYANNVNKPLVEELDKLKPQNVLAGELRTEETMGQTKEGYTALSKGGKDLDDFIEKVGSDEPEVDESVKLKAAEINSRAERQVQAREAETRGQQVRYIAKTQQSNYDKIAGLEAKLDRLKNPSNLEKFKAFFQGGVDKVREKTIDKIDQLKTEIFKAGDSDSFAKLQSQNKKSLEALGESRSRNVDQAQLYIRAKDTVEQIDEHLAVSAALNRSGLGTPLSQEQIDAMQMQKTRALEIMDANKSGHDRFQQDHGEVQRLEKNVSVREKLGMSNKPPQQQVPKQSVGPKV